VCPGVATLGRDEGSSRLAAARRPLATGSARVARPAWGNGSNREAIAGVVPRPLTARECATLDHLARGMTQKMIAFEFEVSINTVGNLAANAHRQLGVHGAVQGIGVAVLVIVGGIVAFAIAFQSTSQRFGQWHDASLGGCRSGSALTDGATEATSEAP